MAVITSLGEAELSLASIGRLRVGVDTVIVHARARDSPPQGSPSLLILRAGLVILVVVGVLRVMVGAGHWCWWWCWRCAVAR